MRQVEVGIVIDHPVAQQAAPRAQWIQQFLANGVWTSERAVRPQHHVKKRTVATNHHVT